MKKSNLVWLMVVLFMFAIPVLAEQITGNPVIGFFSQASTTPMIAEFPVSGEVFAVSAGSQPLSVAFVIGTVGMLFTISSIIISRRITVNIDSADGKTSVWGGNLHYAGSIQPRVAGIITSGRNTFI